jgi:hypothetical protein
MTKSVFFVAVTMHAPAQLALEILLRKKSDCPQKDERAQPCITGV